MSPLSQPPAGAASPEAISAKNSPTGTDAESPSPAPTSSSRRGWWRRLGGYVPRPSIWGWAVLLASLVEAVILSWIQVQDYLTFHSTQGDLGNYNQAFYTTVHGLGFFYYTTNIPGGSGGSLWAVHFSPTLVLLLPFYAIAPSPATLLVLKQLALALGAIPLYGLARVYFRRGPVPLLFAGLYLVSPVTLAIDWNNFDPEAFLPLLTLAALYFFAKGRLVPFLAFWVLALGTIEAAPPILLLFAAGGLVGSFLYPLDSTYWTAVQQRWPLVIALLVAVAWLGLAFLVLHFTGPRGGGFGNAYSTRYTVLHATSVPDVLPQALTHPGDAGAALQYGASSKVLFLELVILATGVVVLLGGLRYVLPFAGYLVLAFLSNNSPMYTLGSQYPALVTGLLFAGCVEGAVLVTDLVYGTSAASRRRELKVALAAWALALVPKLPSTPEDVAAHPRARERLSGALTLLDRNDLAGAEVELRRLERQIGPSLPSVGASSFGPSGTVSQVPPSRDGDPGTVGATRKFRLDPASSPGLMSIAIVALFVLPVTAISNPLIAQPVGGGPSITFGLAPLTADDRALDSALSLLPTQASVLTTSHLFPEVSDRPDAYVVVNGAFLPGSETLRDDVDNWANQSQYILVDYDVDPLPAVYYTDFANLTPFGVEAADDGAYLFERGWTGPPTLFSSYELPIAGGDLQEQNKGGVASGVFASSLGPSFYHATNLNLSKNTVLWFGPKDLYLPPGIYEATFSLEIESGGKGNQLRVAVTDQPVVLRDNVKDYLGNESFHSINDSVARGYTNATPITLAQTNITMNASTSSYIPIQATLEFNWTGTGYVSFPGFEGVQKSTSFYLQSVIVEQLSALP